MLGTEYMAWHRVSAHKWVWNKRVGGWLKRFLNATLRILDCLLKTAEGPVPTDIMQ